MACKCRKSKCSTAWQADIHWEQWASMSSILELAGVITGEAEEQIRWVQGKGLLAQQPSYPSCSAAMTMQERSDIKDKYRYNHWKLDTTETGIQYGLLQYWCPDSSCHKSQSLCEGSFLSKSKLHLRQWLVLLHWWCRQYPITDTAEEAQVAIQVYQYFRDVCSWRLTTIDAPLQVGGPGIVQCRWISFSS